MKYCEACHVKIATPATFCPLCGTLVLGEGTAQRAYPIRFSQHSYYFVLRLLLFCSLLCVAICAAINFLAGHQFWWWLVVATGLLWLWAITTHNLRRGTNAGGRVLMQVVATGVLGILLDAEFGYRGWSVTYVLPAVCGAGIVAIVLLVLFNLTNWSQYVLYQLALGVLGFVPLALALAGFATRLWPSVAVGLAAFACLLMLALFGDSSVKNELVRRLHR